MLDTTKRIVVYPDGEFDELTAEKAAELVETGKARYATKDDSDAYMAWLDSGW